MPDETKQDHFLSNKLYDVLKLLALVVFPAIGTLYFALAGIWGLPSAQEVLSTIVALDTFLGVVIKIGDVSYNNSESKYDGYANADQLPGELVNKGEVLMKVKKLE